MFHAVARTGSFTQAARELYVSQPSVSVQVRRLEEELGQPLFDRLGKAVHLTEAGRALLPYVERLFALAEEAEVAVAEVGGSVRGHVRLGGSTTPGVYLLPRILGVFKAKHPGIEVSLEIANTWQIEERVVRNELDLGVVGGELLGERIAAEIYLTDQLVLIVPPDHPFSQRRSVKLEELGGEPFITREAGSATRAVTESGLAATGVKVQSVLELGNPEAVKRAVGAGLGIAFISRYAVIEEIQAGWLAVVSVSGLNLKRELQIVHHKDKRLMGPSAAFVALARELRDAQVAGIGPLAGALPSAASQGVER